MQLAKRRSLYQQLLDLPDGLTGEVIDGQLHTQPRPAGPHAVAASRLGADIEGPYGRGRGGPGGWWIIDEPEVHFVRDTEVLVPDIAGWRRERMPQIPRDQRFEVVPDWVCEVLSPGTESKDRKVKMPLYARHGVHYAWIVNPADKVLEAYALEGGGWKAVGRFQGDDKVSFPPFGEIAVALGDLWC